MTQAATGDESSCHPPAMSQVPTGDWGQSASLDMHVYSESIPSVSLRKRIKQRSSYTPYHSNIFDRMFVLFSPPSRQKPSVLYLSDAGVRGGDSDLDSPEMHGPRG